LGREARPGLRRPRANTGKLTKDAANGDDDRSGPERMRFSTVQHLPSARGWPGENSIRPGRKSPAPNARHGCRRASRASLSASPSPRQRTSQIRRLPGNPTVPFGPTLRFMIKSASSALAESRSRA